jgi:hypothetical protein
MNKLRVSAVILPKDGLNALWIIKVTVTEIPAVILHGYEFFLDI